VCVRAIFAQLLSLLKYKGLNPEMRPTRELLTEAVAKGIFPALVLGVGFFLRFQQLSDQWLMDDEWHAIHKVLSGASYASIASSFGFTDYSIPLTLYYKWLASRIGLTELDARMPLLMAGMVFLILGMVWSWKRLDHHVAVIFGFLLAISPLLVNFSREARPYMLSLLLGALALHALSRWLVTAETKWGIAYSVSTWLASYLHLAMAPFVLAPMLMAVFWRTGGAGRKATNRALFTLAMIVLGGESLLLLPPLLSDAGAITGKAGSDLPSLATVFGSAFIWLGSGAWTVVLFGLTLAMVGAGQVVRVCKLDAALWAVGIAAVVIAIFVMQPAWVHNPLTFARYLLPLLPMLLLFVAAGIVQVARETRFPLVSMLCLPALFLIGSPEWALLVRPNNFSLHTYYQFDYRERDNPVRMRFAHLVSSQFWRQFSHMAPGTLTLAVLSHPRYESTFNPQPVYQPIHRQHVLDLQTGGACGGPGLGEAFPSQGVTLRNAVSLSLPGDLERKHVDWVVVDTSMSRLRNDMADPEVGPFFRSCEGYLQSRFGLPSYSDGIVQAYRISHDRHP
jgi:hypothetical protein